ncbi:MAG TPA: HAD family hydrolase [Steroidobacteraceae bacterium]
MPPLAETVFLFDVDNTLLDNDRIEADISQHIEEECGASGRDRFWAIFEALRAELGFADYLGAVQRYRLEALHDPRVLGLGSFLLEYPVASRLYPRALDTLMHVGQWGPTVILSDGDAVLQPRKVRRTGIWDAVQARVLIYVHKERMLEDVKALYAAQRYVMVDDKPGILSAMKKSWGAQLTTIFPRQGHYALRSKDAPVSPPPDRTIEHIADLLAFNYSDFSPAG